MAPSEPTRPPEETSIAPPAPKGRPSRAGPADDGARASRVTLAGRRRSLGVAASLAVHGLALVALLSLRTAPPQTEPAPILVALAPDPQPATAGPSPSRPSVVPPTRARSSARPTPAAPAVVVPPASEAPEPEPELEIGEADLAGAATAGNGSEGEGVGAGGGCDLVRALQRALRKDPLVQGAVPAARRAGGAFLVWNGDWVSSPGQEGKGLAAVREAILWEVGFAPAACREAPMRGLVLLSLAEGQGGGRIALGTRDWRWSELLGRSRRPSADAP